MAKTIAEVTLLHNALAVRLDGLAQDTGTLRAADKDFAELLRAVREQAAENRVELAHLRKQLDEERTLGRERDRVVAELQQESAVFRQQLQDYLKRAEVTEAHRRTLFGLLIGAILAFAGNLIAAFIKR